MKTLAPSLSNQQEITNLFRETFFYRRETIRKGNFGPTEFLTEYPRVVDTANGRLVSSFCETTKFVYKFISKHNRFGMSSIVSIQNQKKYNLFTWIGTLLGFI